MKYFLIVTLFCYTMPVVNGQEIKKTKTKSPAQLAVNRIDSIVMTIVKDSTIQWAIVEKKGSKNDKKIPAGYLNSFDIKRAGYRNGQLAILQVGGGHGIQFFSSRTIYFQNTRPVLLIEHFTNSTRMGSCGEISVEFHHYLQDSVAFAGLARSITSFYYCYGYKLQKPDLKKLFAEIDTLKTFFTQHIRSNPAVPQSNQQPLQFFYLFTYWNAINEVQESYGF